jgi:hypothetical protein
VEEGALYVLLKRIKGAREENFGPAVTGAFSRLGVMVRGMGGGATMRRNRGGGGAARWGPGIVPGGGVKRFKPFLNSNSSKMFKKFQTLTIPKMISLSSKNLR